MTQEYRVLVEEKFGKTLILQVLLVKVNFSRIRRYELPARNSGDVVGPGGAVLVANAALCLFQAFLGELANSL